jgi:cytochrome c
MKVLVAAVALCVSLLTGSQAVAQDAKAGEAVFQKCSMCHNVGEGARNKVGPVLNGVVGRPAGSFEGFNYSEAMKASGLTWDEATLTTFLKGPRALVPGTKMTFGGLKTDPEVADVIAYLKQFSADGTLTPAQ